MQIKMQNINKSFNGNVVLDNVCFSLGDKEIHALVGENGAGKSTLMKILTGVYTRDNGDVFVDGKKVLYRNPQEAEKDGIVFIHQELNVLYDLTVEENMFLGKEIHNRFGVCDKKKMQAEVVRILNILGININPKQKMSELSIGQQQMIEIAKALMINAKTIIMDEPTAALTLNETETLFKVARSLRDNGASIIYISHRMEEIFELCDRITVMRDGQFIGTKNVNETNMVEVVKMMIGREIGERYPKRNVKIGDTVLEIKDLNCDNLFSNINFNVRAGEILGVAGLMGAGRSEIMSSIFGIIKQAKKEIFINGKKTQINNPNDAISNGMAYITEDRKIQGLMLEDTIKKNISLVNLKEISNYGILNFKRENKLASKGVKDFHIKCTSFEDICKKLSGGNQQKVIFAKWIFSKPKVLILDEPTRGVDIGAKKEIYSIINSLSSQGVAIIMVSSELPEILGMSDRIMVIHEGKISGFLNIEEANQEKIMMLATGGKI